MKQFSILDMKGNAIINCPSIPKIHYGDVRIQDAEPYCIYIVGDIMKYTIRGLQWIYINHSSQPVQVKMTPFEFNGTDITFPFPVDALGKSCEIYINGLRQYQETDFYIDDRDTAHPIITFDQVYDPIDKVRLVYYKSYTVKEIELVDDLLFNAYFDKYYDKYPGRRINVTDPEFDYSIVYSPVGWVPSSVSGAVSSIKFNQFEFDNSNKQIQIGEDSFLICPLYYIGENNVLYVVSPLLCLLSSDPSISSIALGDTMYKINSNTANKENIKLHSGVSLFDQAGYTHDITYDLDKNLVTFTTGHSAQCVGFHITEGNGTPLTENDVLFRLNTTTGNLGVQIPRLVDGKFVSMIRYPTAQTITPYPYTEAKTEYFEMKMYALNKGSMTLNLEIRYVVD